MSKMAAVAAVEVEEWVGQPKYQPSAWEWLPNHWNSQPPQEPRARRVRHKTIVA
jgi:hypothetical protein